MHPSLVRAHVVDAVAELEARVAAHPGLDVLGIHLDLDLLQLDVTLERDEHVMQIIQRQSPILSPVGTPIILTERLPVIGAGRTRRLVLRLGLDSFDLYAPTAELLDGDRQPLPFDQWPTAMAGGGIIDKHPKYQRPFFCRRGFREFHEHPQHEDKPWARYRDGLPLHAIVIELLEDLHTRWHGVAA